MSWLGGFQPITLNSEPINLGKRKIDFLTFKPYIDGLLNIRNNQLAN
jgi:hypothetical protein